MSPHVECLILPVLREFGRGTVFKTGVVADLLGYKRRRVYDFFVEMERAGLLVRKPGGHVWRLA
jgi:DNA-binding IclR family transcriptional regulator